jgi:transcriptional regulator with XRE-family HTH domain
MSGMPDGGVDSVVDVERRLRLRAFLVHARSRRSPGSVGLPETGRRRVPGLRREEVAEAAGVSTDWYRLFESGRPITVSARLLSRLSRVFALDAFDEAMLFQLAFPELYRAEIVASVVPPPTLSALTAPLAPFSDVEDARRFLSGERERFLDNMMLLTDAAPDDMATILRPRILNSWRRSHELLVEPSCSIALPRVVDDVDERARERLLRAASPIANHLADTLSGVGYVTVITDNSGTILDLRGDGDVRRRLDRIGFEEGTDWSEASAGTNAIGTTLRDERPLQLMSAEHYCEGWQDLTCTAAPIRDPHTGEVIGVLDITGNYRLVHPTLVGTMVQYALAVEECLAILS